MPRLAIKFKNKRLPLFMKLYVFFFFLIVFVMFDLRCACKPCSRDRVPLTTPTFPQIFVYDKNQNNEYSLIKRRRDRAQILGA